MELGPELLSNGRSGWEDVSLLVPLTNMGCDSRSFVDGLMPSDLQPLCLMVF